MDYQTILAEFDLARATPADYLAHVQWTVALQRAQERVLPTGFRAEPGAHPKDEPKKDALTAARTESLAREICKNKRDLNIASAREVAAMYTAYDDFIVCMPNQRQTLREWFRETQNALLRFSTEAAWPFNERLAIGALPMNDLNATFARVPSGGWVIGVSSGLMSYYSLVSMIVTAFLSPIWLQLGIWRLSSSPFRTLHSSIDSVPEWEQMFVDATVAYLTEPSTVFEFPRGWNEKNNMDFRTSLSASWAQVACTFVVAHEFGHLLFKDPDQDSHLPRVSLASGRAVNVSKKERSIANESEADYAGLLATMALMRARGLDPVVSYLGVHLALSAFRHLEKAAGVADSNTHPPTDSRQEQARTLFQSRHARRVGRRGARAAKLLGALLEALWSRNRERILQHVHGNIRQ